LSLGSGYNEINQLCSDKGYNFSTMGKYWAIECKVDETIAFVLQAYKSIYIPDQTNQQITLFLEQIKMNGYTSKPISQGDTDVHNKQGWSVMITKKSDNLFAISIVRGGIRTD
jgi:hypothetical protein